MIWYKISSFFFRLLDIVFLLPGRILRIGKHIIDGSKFLFRHTFSVNEYAMAIGFWWCEFLLLLLEISGIVEIYETLSDWFKFNSRPINKREFEIAYRIFGASIPLHRVRIDEKAVMGPKQKRFCYVSFHTINSWGTMSENKLVHELMHVWQYKKYGALYIVRALRAQFSKEGYDYGGVDALRKAQWEGKGLLSFNFEQQADIIADCFKMGEDFSPSWDARKMVDFTIYNLFLEELQE